MRKINREKFKKKCYVLLRVIVTLYLVIKRNVSRRDTAIPIITRQRSRKPKA
jgi:hypothetical protein